MKLFLLNGKALKFLLACFLNGLVVISRSQLVCLNSNFTKLNLATNESLWWEKRRKESYMFFYHDVVCNWYWIACCCFVKHVICNKKYMHLVGHAHEEHICIGFGFKTFCVFICIMNLIMATREYLYIFDVEIRCTFFISIDFFIILC